jgi:serine/threonine-protein kinase
LSRSDPPDRPVPLAPSLPAEVFAAPPAAAPKPPEAIALPAEGVFAPAPPDVPSAGGRTSGTIPTVPANDAKPADAKPAEPRPKPRRSGLLEPGSILDKYRIERPLGSGAFCNVYEATHLLMRTPVAVKLPRPDVVAARPELPQALCREAGLAAPVHHPNVVRVLDVTHTDRVTYIVMEYVDGGSLAAAIQRFGRLPADRVIRIGLDACAGLEAAGRHGLIHRDIKPANILLTREGAAKIADLGMAVRPQRGPGWSAEPSGVAGTPRYMPPEQALRPASVDCRSDLYSLGVTLYHAAVGRLPLEDPAVRELLRGGRADPAPPEQVLPDFPRSLSAVLLSMIRPDPADRPATPADAARLLRAAASDIQTADEP